MKVFFTDDDGNSRPRPKRAWLAINQPISRDIRRRVGIRFQSLIEISRIRGGFHLIQSKIQEIITIEYLLIPQLRGYQHDDPTNPMEEAPCKRSRTNDDAGTGIMAGGGGDDRLSALPDCLLHEIMSRMKARQVVQTCVLSARWRHLWRSVPCFDADEGEFEFTVAEARAAPTFPDLLEMRWEKFEDFMDILLSPGNVSIAHLDKFRLGFTGCDSESKRGYRWIRRGIKYDGDAAQGPGIQRQGFSSITRSWRLRKLHLDKMCLDALFSEHVGSGCPNLEDLELTECKLEFEAITSGSLKSLVLKKCCMIDGFREITSPMLSSLVIDGGSYTGDCLVVTTAPAAASVFLNVDVSGLFVGGFSLRGMTTSLAKASVRLRSRKIVDALKILGSVSDVMTNLELSQVMVRTLLRSYPKDCQIIYICFF